MSFLRLIYLALAIVGAIVPLYFFWQWGQSNEFTLQSLVNAWTLNAASKGIMWDLTIAAIALAIWILAEVYVRKDYWVAPLCIAATFCIGVSCGLPLYLFLRTRTTK